MEVTRRQFLGSSAAAVVAAGTMANGKVFGANDNIRVACVGIRGRGGSHIGAFTTLPGSEVVALCDADRKVLEKRAAQVQENTGKRPKTYVDMRDVMADDTIDVVTFATPNHWHSLGTIWACQAGKDVYVEKPLSHNIWEGRKLVEAAEKYGRIVQHGTQRRSDRGWIRAIQRMRDGEIGDIYMARALCYKRRNSIGFGEPMDPPANLDWDLWQGPAPARQYMDYPNKEGDRGIWVHYNWHWFWDFGNGDIGNQGVHQMDVAVWGMNKGLPVEVYSQGGRYTYEDQAETPNTLVSTMTYADGAMTVFEVRGRYTNDEEGVRIGNLFYGSEGHLAERKLFDKEGKEMPDPNPDAANELSTGNCFENFLNAVRSRRLADVHGNALDGHIGAAHCHLANIAYRTDRRLEFDPEKERFTNSREANKLLTRKYRKPFEVPKKV